MTPRILLVHGLSSSAESWWRVEAFLAARGWDATTIDLRGHGAADRADSYELAAYATDLPGEGWDVVVGHSLGAAAAVIAAGRPGFARSLVLLDPVLEVGADEFDAILDDQLSELELTEASIAALKPHWHERDRAAKLSGIRATDATVVARSFTDNPGWNVVAQARALAVPTLILGGDHSVYSMLSTETARQLVAANPLIEYRVIDGAAHSPHRDRPDETLAAIGEWLLGR